MLFEDSETNVHFKKTILSLNSEMVVIIGSRGAGKSLLLDTIGTLFQHQSIKKELKLSENFKAELQIGEKTIDTNVSKPEAIDYIHVRQDMIKDIAELPRELSNHVLKLLQIDELELNGDEERINQLINKFFDNLKKIEEYDINRIQNEKLRINQNLSILSNETSKKEIEELVLKQKEISNMQKSMELSKQ